MPDLVLRKAVRADTDEICALLRRSFPDNPKGQREVLDWQYWDNPFGAPTVWVWEDGDRVVGHYTVVPYPAKVRGRPGRLGIGIDAAIDPDYQGRQLFGPLTSSLYADAVADGVAAIVCYPNDSSVRGIRRQGWREVGLLRTQLLPLRPQWYAEQLHVPAAVLAPFVALAARRTVGGAHGHVSAEVDDLGSEPDRLWAAVEHETHSGVVRDASWLRWRYRDRPGPSPYRFFVARRDGGLRALAVTTEREQRGGRFTYLMELLSVDGQAARAVVGAAAAAAKGSAGVLVPPCPGRRWPGGPAPPGCGRCRSGSRRSSCTSGWSATTRRCTPAGRWGGGTWTTCRPDAKPCLEPVAAAGVGCRRAHHRLERFGSVCAPVAGESVAQAQVRGALARHRGHAPVVVRRRSARRLAVSSSRPGRTA